MRALLLAAVMCAAALFPGVAAAQSCTGNTIGSFTYTNCADGSTATSSRIGDSTYTNYSDGSSSTTTRIGNQAYTNYSDGTSATSTQIGNYGYTSYSDGASATTTRIGPNTTTTYSDGTTVTSTPIGGGTTSSVVGSSTATSAPAPPTPYGVQASINGALYTLPPGLLVKGSGSAIYVIFDGRRWVFGDWADYLAYGGKPDLSNVLVLRDADLAPIPLGPVVPPHR